MERNSPVRKPHTSTADLLTWPENSPFDSSIDSAAPGSRPAVRSHQPSDRISKVLFGGQVTDEEAESLLQRKPCSGSKLKEMTGSGIFAADGGNEGLEPGSPLSTPNNKTGLRIYQQAVSGISQISFSADETVTPKKPISLTEVAKQRELSGTLESDTDAKIKKQQSDAKSRELSGHDIFGPPPEIPPRPLAARSEPKESKDIDEPAPRNVRTSVKVSNHPGGQSNIMFSEEPVIKTAKKIHNQKFAELTGNDIFKGDAPPESAEKPLSVAKLREMSGSDIFADGKAASRDYLGGVRKAPGDSCTREVAFGNCTAVGFDERMLLHSEVEMKSRPHPERPDRLRAIAASLATSGIFPGKCSPILAREITKGELQMVHSLEHIEAVEFTSSMLASYFTQDTYANEHSARAARLAAGLCADLASAIMSGQTKNGFALVRPPGHHAGIKQAMGFCLYNNAAVAALAAQAAGAKKVLIVDWDVHHGNGTQEIFEGNRSVLYISLHRHEEGLFYPGTGAVNEVGIMGAEGYCVNIPWKCGGVGDNDYIFAFRHVVLPIALEFAPDLTIISAGFDAARGDPLGCCDVTPAGFAQMTHMLSGLSHGKLLVILEGGYNLRSISSSATAVVKVLLGEGPRYELDDKPSKHCLGTILEVMKVQMKYWPILESSYSGLLSQWKALSFQIRSLDPEISDGILALVEALAAGEFAWGPADTDVEPEGGDDFIQGFESLCYLGFE